MTVSGHDKQIDRILDHLSRRGQSEIGRFAGGRETDKLLRSADGKQIAVTTKNLAQAQREDLIELHEHVCSLTRLGIARVKRLQAEGHQHAAQHRMLRKSTLSSAEGTDNVVVNDSESPLTRLYSRKTKSGGRWIDEAQLAAGERLRRDFTFGQLQQKVTASWDPTAGMRSKGANAAMADLGDSALDARTRLQKALDRVGPDLGGVLLDVCCFLKGLELVERERKWPPRSAKLMLRTGLEILARHYGTRPGRGSDAPTSWVMDRAATQTPTGI